MRYDIVGTVVTALLGRVQGQTAELYGYVSRQNSATSPTFYQGWVDILETPPNGGTVLGVISAHVHSVTFYDRPFPLAGMTKDFDTVANCNEAYLGASNAMFTATNDADLNNWINRLSTGKENMLRWTTAMLKDSAGEVIGCTTMIDGDSDRLRSQLLYAKIIEPQATLRVSNGIVFCDNIADPGNICLSNIKIGDNPLIFGTSDCDDFGSNPTTYLAEAYTGTTTVTWVDDNSWQRYVLDNNHGEVASVIVEGVCYELNPGMLPSHATTRNMVDNEDVDAVAGETGFIRVSFEQITPFHETKFRYDYHNVDAVGDIAVREGHIFGNEEFDVTGAIYNPYSISSACAENTHDCVAVGALGLKHGHLADLMSGLSVNDAPSNRAVSSGDYTGYDYNLPLWGLRSIAGRSVCAAFSGDDTDYRVCGPISTLSWEADVYPPVIEGRVEFDPNVCTGALCPAEGSYIYFMQNANDWTAPTHIISNVFFNDATTADQSHGWHVHTTGYRNGYQAECANTDGHYHPDTLHGVMCQNPNLDFYTDIAGVDSCEVGDLAAKHGSLVIGGSGPNANSNTGVETVSGTHVRQAFTDIWLPLAGTNSIIDRSVVIHDTDNSRLYCGRIKQMPTYLKAFFDSNTIKGWVYIDQTLGFNDMSLASIDMFDEQSTELGTFGATGYAGWLNLTAVDVLDNPLFSPISFIYKKPYPRADMFSTPTTDPCEDTSTGGYYDPILTTQFLTQVNHLTDMAWTTLRLVQGGTAACATLVPDNARVKYAAGMGGDGYAQVFVDENNDVGIINADKNNIKLLVGTAGTVCSAPEHTVTQTLRQQSTTYTGTNDWERITNLREINAVDFSTTSATNCIETGWTPGHTKTKKHVIDDTVSPKQEIKLFLYQKTPFEPTRVIIDNEDINNVITTMQLAPLHRQPLESCADIHSTMFNPFNIADDSANTVTATSDTWKVGNFAGKYANHLTLGNIIVTTYDGNLPLWGMNSVATRSVAFYGSSGNLVDCQNLGLTTNREFYNNQMQAAWHEAWVHFSGPLKGSIVLQQLRQSEPEIPTEVTAMTPTMIRYTLLQDQESGQFADGGNGGGATVTNMYNINMYDINSIEPLAYSACDNLGQISNANILQQFPGSDTSSATPCSNYGMISCKTSPGNMFQLNHELDYVNGVGVGQYWDYALPMFQSGASDELSVIFRTLALTDVGNSNKVACSPILEAAKPMDSAIKITASTSNEKTAAMINEVFAIFEANPIPSSRKKRQLADIADQVKDIGCWCSKPVTGSAPGGQPVSELDAICRTWAMCNRCENLIECEGEIDPNYEVVYTQTVNCTCVTGTRDLSDFISYECVNQNECTKNRCECDMSYALELYSYIYSIGGVIPTENMNTPEDQCIPGRGIGSYVCCGVSPTWEPYNEVIKQCVFNEETQSYTVTSADD